MHGLGWVQYGLGAIGVILILLGLIAPGSLRALNRARMKLGLILFKVVSPVVLALIYGTTMVPIGLVMRVSGHDPLRLKLDPRLTGTGSSAPGPAPETMINQF